MASRKYLKLHLDLDGIRYGSQIFLGTCGLWFLSRLFGINPLWPIVSLIIVTEINMETTWHGFKLRIINTIAGCLTGLLFLALIRPGGLLLPLALATTVCVSIYLIRIPYGWRIAAITAAIVILPALAADSRSTGIAVACERTLEVFLGSAMAVLVTWLFSILAKSRVRYS